MGVQIFTSFYSNQNDDDDEDDDNDALAVLHPFQQSFISGYCKGDCKDPVPVKSCRFGFSENYNSCEN